MDYKDFDLSQVPAVLEASGDIMDYIHGQSNRRLLSRLKKIRESLSADTGLEIPKVSLEVDEQLCNAYRFRIFGAVVSEGEIDSFSDDWEDDFFESIKEIMEKNCGCFRDGYFDDKILELAKEQTRESFYTLWTYYRHKKNEKLAFHWLKKLCYFNVPKDLRSLMQVYRTGIGCHMDKVQVEKIRIRMKGKGKGYYNF